MIEPISIFRHSSSTPAIKVTIIVPTYNASSQIAATVESILSQLNCHFEAIFVDGSSTDRTVDIIRSYNDSRLKVQEVPSHKRFEMVNRGIAMAQGDYISMLLPGDVFISTEALNSVCYEILSSDLPNLFYTAAYIWDEWDKPHFLFRPLTRDLLRQGLQPTNLQACFIKKQTFKKIGYFNIDLTYRGGFDFLLRFSLDPSMTYASIMRVYIIPAVVSFTYNYSVGNVKETFQLLQRNFGFLFAVLWLTKQKILLKHIAKKIIRRISYFISGKEVW